MPVNYGDADLSRVCSRFIHKARNCAKAVEKISEKIPTPLKYINYFSV